MLQRIFLSAALIVAMITLQSTTGVCDDDNLVNNGNGVSDLTFGGGARPFTNPIDESFGVLYSVDGSSSILISFGFDGISMGESNLSILEDEGVAFDLDGNALLIGKR